MAQPDDFAALARRIGLSDARLGMALGLTGKRPNIAVRIRQWKRGARPVPDEVMSMLRALAAAAQGLPVQNDDAAIAPLVDRVAAPEWIIGHAHDAHAGMSTEETDEAAVAEYLVHTRRPRFVCRIVDADEDEPAWRLEPLRYADGAWLLCDFTWFDRAPEGAALSALLRRAMGVLGGR